MADDEDRRDEDLRIGAARGPYDIDELVTPVEDLGNSHLDLGSVLVPVVQGGQVTVEMSANHVPEAVHLLTPHGRIGVTAFAAPKSPGLWREVVRELAQSLRDGGAKVRVEDGHWGREVVADVEGGTHRFIGVDGPRWMVRCVASGPTDTEPQRAQLARAVLAETVIRRGGEPYPPREMLPIVLPPVLAEQVAAAQQQNLGGTREPGSEPVTRDELARAAEVAAAQKQAEAADDEPGDRPEAGPAGGARDQLAKARVITEEPQAPAADVEADPAAPSATESAAAPAADPSDEAPTSPGSAMQRLRFRRR